ncbi:MAG: PEGA domain-containing protein, partial [Armatimonadetes bacterium]|nr:PEGA domain-containing protein [Armatimonadota bacterium]
PLSVFIPAGHHEIRVSKDDNYVPFEQTITAAPGTTITIQATLTRTAASLYKDGVAAFRAGNYAESEALLTHASLAHGKRPHEIAFYLGLIAQHSGHHANAEKQMVAFLAVQPGSASGQYHLGVLRQAAGQDALAATAYKNALIALAPVASGIIGSAGPPTHDNIARQQQEARQPGNYADRIQLAYLLELKGSVHQARDLYRDVFERLCAANKVDLTGPRSVQVDVPVAEDMKSLPAFPANAVYVTAGSSAQVQSAWQAYSRLNPEMAGKAVVSAPTNNWVALVARPFDQQDQVTTNKACKALSSALSTDVLYLLVTPDGRAWYYLWRRGTLVDQYCSNPGRMGEVGYQTLRAWGGNPAVLSTICRGTPLSSKGPGYVTITDLNAVVYFYYPEMRMTRPAAWRTASTLMKVLARLIGLPGVPLQFAASAQQPGWRQF